MSELRNFQHKESPTARKPGGFERNEKKKLKFKKTRSTSVSAEGYAFRKVVFTSTVVLAAVITIGYFCWMGISIFIGQAG